jgi:hypothetical protein
MFEAIKNQPPPHSCAVDGHLTLMMSLYCPACGAKVRDTLTVDENHIKHGEFWS